MSEETIQTQCPGCHATFDVPEEMLGQDAECPECSATFVIEARKKTMPPVDGDDATAEGEVSSNTVKVSRTSIGMLPEIDDEVTGLGLLQQRQRNTRTQKVEGLGKREGKDGESHSWWAFWKR